MQKFGAASVRSPLRPFFSCNGLVQWDDVPGRREGGARAAFSRLIMMAAATTSMTSGFCACASRA